MEGFWKGFLWFTQSPLIPGRDNGLDIFFSCSRRVSIAEVRAVGNLMAWGI